MKKSKRSKARVRDNKVDHISNLPDPILHLILSRLHSTEEVIRNSILSTRWKYLWTSVPSLNIDSNRKVKRLYILFHKNEFKEFVVRVLTNRTLDLDSFTLNCRLLIDMSTIGQWIDLVVMHKVKQLNLTAWVVDDDESDDVMLPRCLLDCDSLEVLKLDLFGSSLSFESFTGSKTLTIFELDNVELLDHGLVHSFLVNWPLLEELSLIDCSTQNLDYLDILCPNLKTLRIDNRGLYSYIQDCLHKRLKLLCPKLVYLEYRGYMANHFLFDIKSLKKAVIEVKNTEDFELIDDIFGTTICELFAQVSHVEYLWINYDFVKGITPEEVETFVDEFDEVERRRTLTCHLQRVEFPKFSGEKELLAIARFLLEHGNALEEMVFNWSNKDKYHTQSMNTMNEVSNYYKASLSVKVITLLKDSYEKRYKRLF